MSPQTDPATRIDPTMTGLFCLRGVKGNPGLERAAEKDMKVECGMSLMMCSIRFN